MYLYECIRVIKEFFSDVGGYYEFKLSEYIAVNYYEDYTGDYYIELEDFMENSTTSYYTKDDFYKGLDRILVFKRIR